MKCRVIVEGNVQGVGYRSLVKQTARGMRIKGKVKNLDDGAVEIYCDTGIGEIEEFIKRIDVKGDKENVFSLNVGKISIFNEGDEGYVEPEKELGVFEIDYEEEAVSTYEKSSLERLEIGSLMLLGLGGKVDDGFTKLGDKIDSGFKKTDANFKTLGEKMDSGFSGMGSKIDSLGDKIDSGFKKTDENFNDLSDRYGVISKNLEAINRNISKLTEAILTLIKGTPKRRRETKSEP